MSGHTGSLKTELRKDPDFINGSNHAMGKGVLSVCKSNRPEERIIQRHLLISWVPSEVAPVRYGYVDSGSRIFDGGALKRKAQDNDLEFLNACLFYRLCFYTKYQLSPFLIFGINTSSLITEVNIDKKWRCRSIAHNFFVFLTKKTGKTAKESNYDVLFTKSNVFRKSFHRSYFHFAFVFVIYACVHIRRACEIIPAHTYLIYQQCKLCKLL